jgi:EpsI family protein
MKKIKTFLIFAVMLLAAWGAVMMTPVSLYKRGDWVTGTLAGMIPNQFGDWRLDTNQAAQIISPDQAAWIQKLYSETVNRTYVDSKGRRVMLSLAYGADQGRALQVHKPESCYGAQGFKIFETIKTHTPTQFGDVPNMRVVAQLGTRHEPVTYWIRSGDYIVRGWYEQNLSRVRFGLKGYLPDGLLVRVSSVTNDDKEAYAVQDAFIQQMVAAVDERGRKMLLGQELLTSHSAVTANGSPVRQ